MNKDGTLYGYKKIHPYCYQIQRQPNIINKQCCILAVWANKRNENRNYRKRYIELWEKNYTLKTDTFIF